MILCQYFREKERKDFLLNIHCKRTVEKYKTVNNCFHESLYYRLQQTV